MGKKLAGYALMAFLLFYVLKNPAAAAGTAKHLGAMLADVGTAVGKFLGALTGSGGGHG